MTIKTKLIKSKSFKMKDGAEHTHYTVAYKSRVFGVNTLNFEGEDEPFEVDEKAKTLTIKCDIEVKRRVVDNPLEGSTTSYLDIVPKLGLELAAL